MPYFVYKITSGSTGAIKVLELIDSFDEFKPAKNFAREQRTIVGQDSRTAIKMIFAKDELEAEQRLREPRHAPILREWEK